MAEKKLATRKVTHVTRLGICRQTSGLKEDNHAREGRTSLNSSHDGESHTLAQDLEACGLERERWWPP